MRYFVIVVFFEQFQHKRKLHAALIFRVELGLCTNDFLEVNY